MANRPATLKRHLVVGITALTCSIPGLRAEEGVPHEVQAAILMRLLTYDRALSARTVGAGGAVVLGIVAKSEDRSSASAQAGLAQAISVLQAGRVPLRLAVVTTGYEGAANLGEWLAKNKVQVLYVAPGLGAELEEIRGVCAPKRVVTVTAVRDFVGRGLVAGIVLKGDRPGILVNLPAATAAGMDLDPKLLALSEVIR